jgi:hypothetical protein
MCQNASGLWQAILAAPTKAAEQRTIIAHDDGQSGSDPWFLSGRMNSAPGRAKEWFAVDFLPPHPGLESFADD